MKKEHCIFYIPVLFCFCFCFLKQEVPRLHDSNHWVKIVQVSLITWITQKTKDYLNSARLKHEGSELTLCIVYSISQCSSSRQSRLTLQQCSLLPNSSLNSLLSVLSLRLTCSDTQSSIAKSNFCLWEGDIVSNFFPSSVTWVYALDSTHWKLNSTVIY